MIYCMCDLIEQISKVYNNCFDELSIASAEVEQKEVNSIVNRSCCGKQYDYVYLAFGVMLPKRVKSIMYKNNVFVYIGKNYRSNKTSKLSSPSLATGAVLGVEARIEILDYNEGVCRKELERVLAMHQSTLYHHLSLLIESGAVRFVTSSSKNHLFYINNSFFDKLIEALQKYTTKQ